MTSCPGKPEDRRRTPAARPAIASLSVFRRLAARHKARLIAFTLIGVFAFSIQFGMQIFLVQKLHAGPVTSYVGLTIACIQLSFLLNRRYTWRDRQVSLWAACYRFNAQRVVTVAVNLALYAGLVRLAMNYLLANVLTAGLFMIVNYLVGDTWTFAPGARRADDAVKTSPD